jgi:chemotaxis regulatin CheY-phosphate phosphatase CheZ|tara:strand:+ start:48 stop:392 length:345 start_codon:yes stop_codon:yes gene_type:complete
MELDARLLITLGGMLISVVSSFVVVRQKVGDLESDLRDAIKKLSALDNRLDRNDTATELTGQRLDVIAGMNSVAERDKLSRAFEKTEVLLPILDERIRRLEHMHNGKHGPVPND